jgi:hypothetical protein
MDQLIINDHEADHEHERRAREHPAVAAMGVDHVDKHGPADAGNAESEDYAYGMTHYVYPPF